MHRVYFVAGHVGAKLDLKPYGNQIASYIDGIS